VGKWLAVSVPLLAVYAESGPLNESANAIFSTELRDLPSVVDFLDFLNTSYYICYNTDLL
jgi:hypothetical protein